MDWWNGLTASFKTQDWFSFWTLVVAVLTIAINLGVALWNSKKVDKKLLSMDERPTARPALRFAVHGSAFGPAPPSIMERRPRMKQPPPFAALALAFVSCEAIEEGWASWTTR